MTDLLETTSSAKPCQGYTDNNLHRARSQVKNDFSIKNHKRNAQFRIYANCVEYRPPKYSGPKKINKSRTRGRIHKFTKKARFRLFRLMAKIKEDLTRKPLFITLTYHYGNENSNRTCQEHFHNFLTQLRKFDNRSEYIWRLEYQKRGAPHFHLIIFPGLPESEIPDMFYSVFLSNIWHKIADPNSAVHAKYGFKQKTIKNYKMACAYISKYCAKVNDDIKIESGHKQWGNSRNLPIDEKIGFGCDRQQSYILIELIRKWLLKNGKDRYASNEYFNIYRPQVIFISVSDFDQILSEYNLVIEKGFDYG